MINKLKKQQLAKYCSISIICAEKERRKNKKYKNYFYIDKTPYNFSPMILHLILFIVGKCGKYCKAQKKVNIFSTSKRILSCMAEISVICSREFMVCFYFNRIKSTGGFNPAWASSKILIQQESEVMLQSLLGTLEGR